MARKQKIQIAVTRADAALLRMYKGEVLTTAQLNEEIGMARPWDSMSSLIRQGHPIKTIQVTSDCNDQYLQNAYFMVV